MIDLPLLGLLVSGAATAGLVVGIEKGESVEPLTISGLFLWTFFAGAVILG